MIDFEFRPSTYFDGTGPSALIAKLAYPESRWGEEICLYATPLDGEIHYEVVDFYGNDYQVKPAKSKDPLNLQELILLIERLEVKKKGELGEINTTLLGIPEAKSLHYPGLENYFRDKRKHFGMQ